MRLGKGSFVLGAVVALVVMAVAGPVKEGRRSTLHLRAPQRRCSEGSSTSREAPGVPAVDPRTHTLYVPIQCPPPYCSPNAPTTRWT